MSCQSSEESRDESNWQLGKKKKKKIIKKKKKKASPFFTRAW